MISPMIGNTLMYPLFLVVEIFLDYVQLYIFHIERIFYIKKWCLFSNSISIYLFRLFGYFTIVVYYTSHKFSHVMSERLIYPLDIFIAFIACVHGRHQRWLLFIFMGLPNWMIKLNYNRIINLNDINYHKWRNKMKNLLFVKDYIYLYLYVKNQIIHLMKNGFLSMRFAAFIQQLIYDNILIIFPIFHMLELFRRYLRL